MPLTGTGPLLATEIVTAIVELDPTMTPAAKAKLIASWTAIANALILHITLNALVNTVDTGTAAVSTAPGTAPVTATGTGTVT